MNVTRIDCNQPTTSFRGIFANEEKQVNDNIHYSNGLEEYVGTKETLITADYYKYKDEPAKTAEKAILEYESKSNKHGNDFVKYIEKYTAVLKETLPFTEKEAQAFMKKHNSNEAELIKLLDFFKMVIKK